MFWVDRPKTPFSNILPDWAIYRLAVSRSGSNAVDPFISLLLERCFGFRGAASVSLLLTRLARHASHRVAISAASLGMDICV